MEECVGWHTISGGKSHFAMYLLPVSSKLTDHSYECRQGIRTLIERSSAVYSVYAREWCNPWGRLAWPQCKILNPQRDGNDEIPSHILVTNVVHAHCSHSWFSCWMQIHVNISVSHNRMSLKNSHNYNPPTNPYPYISTTSRIMRKIARTRNYSCFVSRANQLYTVANTTWCSG